MSSNVDAVDSFETFLKNIKTSPNLNTLTTRISNQLLDVFWVEMATVYMVDPAGKLLVSWLLLPGETLRKICTPITKSSISGCVAATGKKTMIRDVYDVMELASIDPELKFDSSWDRKTGNRTRQILTVPICYGENVLGVLQLINKRHNGNFIDSDERNSELLASLLGQILEKIRKSKPEKKPGKFDKLIEGGVLSAGDLKNAVLLAKQEKSDVESILLEKFAISKDQLGICLANFYHTNFVDLTLDKYDPSGFLKGMNIDYFLKTRLVPLSIEENKVVLASDNPYDQSRLPDVMKAFGASQAEVFFAFGFDMEFYVERLSQLCLERERARVREKIMAKVPGDEQPKVEAKLTSDSKPIV
ncbi:MAG: GAF domain-containing protein, partial [Desulfobulbaceae bacterium]|nr:GAF domain-containing protein [Desulfobulbaceae bacterium]